MAYVLGFFAADGNLIKNKRGACFFSLEICDLDILKKIRGVMGSEHTIGYRLNKNDFQRKPAYRLQIGSKDIYNDLHRLGFVANKTYNMSVPLVPESYFLDFVRGYFDGDGNVWTGMVHKERSTPLFAIQTVFTSCSEVFLLNLMQRLERYGIKGRLRKEKSYYRLVYSIGSSIQFFSFMYKEYKGTLYLRRKKVIFDSYLKRKNAVVA